MYDMEHQSSNDGHGSHSHDTLIDPGHGFLEADYNPLVARLITLFALALLILGCCRLGGFL